MLLKLLSFQEASFDVLDIDRWHRTKRGFPTIRILRELLSACLWLKTKQVEVFLCKTRTTAFKD